MTGYLELARIARATKVRLRAEYAQDADGLSTSRESASSGEEAKVEIGGEQPTFV